jgi:hypothetical protein
LVRVWVQESYSSNHLFVYYLVIHFYKPFVVVIVKAIDVIHLVFFTPRASGPKTDFNIV